MKEQAYQFCEAYILARLKRIKEGIEEIKLSLNSETKSSAGDKHETGRAMLQLEREKLGKQLFEAEKTKENFAKVPTTKNNDVVGIGNLVQTDKGYYFIAISAGLLTIGDVKIYCISPQTPLASQILGQVIGHRFVINSIEQTILSIA